MTIEEQIKKAESELLILETQLKGLKEEQLEEIYNVFNKINYQKGFIAGLKVLNNN